MYSISAPSERIFSAAGRTITKLQASSDSANATDLNFSHDSWPAVEIYVAEKGNKKRKRLFSSYLVVSQLAVHIMLLLILYMAQIL